MAKTAKKASLKLFLLGRPQVFFDGEPVTGFVSEKALGLLCYLAVQCRLLGRDTLAGLLWGEMPENRARANLRMALYNLQKLLPGYLQVTRLEVAFNHEKDYWLDVKEFETLVTAQEQRLRNANIDDPARGEAPQVTTDLYRGDFLEGFFIEASPDFEDWITIERERLRQMAVNYFQSLADEQFWQGDYANALPYLQRLLSLAPWHENAYRRMMLALARTGDYTAALRQYANCRRILGESLGVEPMSDTVQLYRRICTARDRPNRHNLPPSSSLVIGREKELNRLARLLAAGENRLINIIGPGGIGKTSLAVAVASAQLNKFLDGVFFVQLASLPDSAYLPIAIGSTLGITFTGKEKPKQQLLNALKERETLLVLDNFEHLIEGAGLVDDLLQAARSLKILVTSRQRLNLKEELIFEIEGLPYPAEDSDKYWETYPAVRLFTENARRVYIKFSPGEADRLALIRICRAVEGLPLALEMASAWVGRVSCTELAKRLESSLSFLETSLRNVPERHRSIKAVFDHSWNLISKQEQEVLNRASVFRGGFTAEAAWQVANAPAEILQALAQKSLLRWISIPGEQPIYDFHEVIRQYAFEQLEESGDAQKIA